MCLRGKWEVKSGHSLGGLKDLFVAHVKRSKRKNISLAEKVKSDHLSDALKGICGSRKEGVKKV